MFVHMLQNRSLFNICCFLFFSAWGTQYADWFVTQYFIYVYIVIVWLKINKPDQIKSTNKIWGFSN